MAVAFTVLGTGTQTAGTAASTTVTTVSGRLYAVVSWGSYETFLGGGYTGLTVSGPTTTQHIFQKRASRHDCLVAIDTFVGSGGSQTVTTTLSGLSGSPRWPVCAVSVIEVTGSTSVNRSAGVGSDGNTAASVSHAASYTTGNRALGAMALAFYATGGTIAPSGGATEIIDGLIIESGTGSGGYGFTNGNNLAYHAQWVDSITSSVTFSQDDYGEALVILEFVGSNDVTGTVARTLGAVTAAATATAYQNVTGSVAATLGATVASAASAESMVGTVAATLGTATATVAASETLAATVGRVLGAVTAAATATESTTATLAVTLAATTSASTAAVTITGMVTATSGAVTSTIIATSADGPAGTVNVTLGAVSPAITAAETIAGVATCALGSTNVSASAAETMSAAVAATLGATTAVGVVAESMAGTVAHAMGAATSAATATVTITGAASCTLSPTTAAVTATTAANVTGTVSRTLGPVVAVIIATATIARSVQGYSTASERLLASVGIEERAATSTASERLLASATFDISPETP